MLNIIIIIIIISSSFVRIALVLMLYENCKLILSMLLCG